MIRFTKEFIQKILEENEGHREHGAYVSMDCRGDDYYSITGGKLWRHSIGKNIHSGSRYEETVVCDIDETRRFLILRRHTLNYIKDFCV